MTWRARKKEKKIKSCEKHFSILADYFENVLENTVFFPLPCFNRVLWPGFVHSKQAEIILQFITSIRGSAEVNHLRLQLVVLKLRVHWALRTAARLFLLFYYPLFLGTVCWIRLPLTSQCLYTRLLLLSLLLRCCLGWLCERVQN